MWIYAGHDH